MERTDAALARLRTRVLARKRYAATLLAGDILHTPSGAFLVQGVERADPALLFLRGGGGVTVQVLTEYNNGVPLEHNLCFRDTQEVLVHRPGTTSSTLLG